MSIVLGLGSNLGDRVAFLRQACVSLQDHQIRVRRSASLYLTEPRDVLDQPWFLNTVVEVETELAPPDLLTACLAIEREAGRVRTELRGPRPIDMDVIVFGDQQIQAGNLTVPHPRYAQRRFVLVPLAELLPVFRDPVSGFTIEQLMAQCPDTGDVRYFAPPLL